MRWVLLITTIVVVMGCANEVGSARESVTGGRVATTADLRATVAVRWIGGPDEEAGCIFTPIAART